MPTDFNPHKNKNIIICCDGTWNEPDQLDNGEKAPTNVWKIFDAIDKKPPNKGQVWQSCWYDPGVGAELGLPAQFITWLAKLGSKYLNLEKIGVVIEGVTGLGVSENIREAYTWLSTVYVPGDRIYFFGFSRGAFQIRSLSGMIHDVGLLKPEHTNRVKEVFKIYQKRDKNGELLAKLKKADCFSKEVSIHFLGVWDTVAGLGLPMWGWSFGHVTKHNTHLVPIIKHAYHALAMDEQRSSFMPVILQKPDTNTKSINESFEQVWFRGCHADIGGGYRETGLSDITLRWMMDKAEANGLRFRPALIPETSAIYPLKKSPIHSQLVRNKAYILAGTWPRMFPLPNAYHQGLAIDDVGNLHSSVYERSQAIAALSSQEWYCKPMKSDETSSFPLNEGGNYAVPDPRETPWQMLTNTEKEFKVYADQIWNPTGVVLEKGQCYDISVSGQWFDLHDLSDANGCTSWQAYQKNFKLLCPITWIFSPRTLFWWAKRHPSAPWMQLIGMINRPTNWEMKFLPAWKLVWYLVFADPKELIDRQFPIGNHIRFTANQTGHLYCYANDMWIFYGNNSGCVDITIKKIECSEPVQENLKVVNILSEPPIKDSSIIATIIMLPISIIPLIIGALLSTVSISVAIVVLLINDIVVRLAKHCR